MSSRGLVKFLLLIFFTQGLAQLVDEDQSSSPKRLIVRFKTDHMVERTAIFQPLRTSSKMKPLRMEGLYRVEPNEGETVDDAMQRLKADPEVDFVEPDIVLHTAGRVLNQVAPVNDPEFSKQTAMAQIKMAEAWSISKGSALNRVRVCVVDTGLDFNHPDLQVNAVPGYNAIDDSESTDRGLDEVGHGTHCAGTIGATHNNNLGIAGINQDVEIVACKFMSGTSGYLSDAIDCINWCRDQNVTITSNSWGGGGASEAMAVAIRASCSAGHLFVSAAGNQGTNNDVNPSFPSSYSTSHNLSCVISVAATETATTLAPFSNYGTASTHIGAPGVDILSTYANGTYVQLSGTSMAAPHVSGVLALMAAANPALTGPQLMARLLSSADVVPNLTGSIQNGRVLNAYAALQSVTTNPPPPSSPPSITPPPPTVTSIAACATYSMTEFAGQYVSATETAFSITTVTDVAECRESCSSESQCLVFTYRVADMQCWRWSVAASKLNFIKGTTFRTGTKYCTSRGRR